MKIILASQSPRRRQLLAEAGYDFAIHLPSDGAETGPIAGETPRDLVMRHARDKAADVAPSIDEGFVIGSDTVADCDGEILGKPKDRLHAKEMLIKLRGREHLVHSGLCVWQRPADKVSIALDTTILRMREISDTQLSEYLDSNLWHGKAGAFGYQDRTGWLEIVSGSESNVVGLPMELLQRTLADMMCD